MTEQQAYDVVRKGKSFELRRYPEHAVAEVQVEGDFDGAGNRAFRYLFGYISGENRTRGKIGMTAPVVQEAAESQKIEMTAPVVQRQAADAGSFTVAFVLPAGMNASTAPEPTRPEVRIRQVASSLSAVSRYSGRWTRQSYDAHCAELMESIAAAGLTALGRPRFARFDPPYKPWFLRRNEVVVDVRDGAAD